jgi:hypothetical protein
MRVALQIALAAILFSGCGKDREPAPDPAASGSQAAAADVLDGTLSVGGEPARLVACQPGHDGRVFLDVVSSRGTVRFRDARLWWNPRSGDPGHELACDRLDRSWGGGVRLDGTAYWRGTLRFQCRHEAMAIDGDLVLDCGQITAQERAQLDANRDRARDEGGR